MTNIKKLVIDFERYAAIYQKHGLDKRTAERLAMTLALENSGRTKEEAQEMVDNIFRFHEKGTIPKETQ